MNRRKFATALAGLAAARSATSADSDRKIRYYWMDTFQLKQGTQPARMHEWFREALVPKLAQVHGGPVMVLEAAIAAHTPQIVLIVGLSSLDEIVKVQTKLNSDPAIASADRKLDSAVEPPFESETVSILEATPYSPELVVQKREKPRYFELRVYHSPRASQLRALHERFAGPEIKIFHQVGIHPVLYSSTLIGPNMPNLTYLIPFDSLADREKAWNAFGAHPDWIKARDESIAKAGQIVAVNDISIYRATPYSPVS
jgi:NIPSNAP